MLNAIAVDDEKKALERFARVVGEERRIELIGAFSSVGDAMKFVRSNQVDIAFLDIEMPSGSGLDLAQQLLADNPSMDIVMVTAYDRYALRAFQAHVTGYLLKPVDIADVQEQIDHVIRKRGRTTNVVVHPMLDVHCFGPFHCHPFGRESDVVPFRTAKAEELFAFLLHHQGRPVSKETIIENLWPEADPAKANNHFHVTCTYLRNALAEKGFEDIFIRDRDHYRLNFDRLQCDMMRFLSIVRQLNDDASEIYPAPYFDNKAYDWAVKTRIWFENQYAGHQYRLSDQYAGKGETGKAMEAVERILERNPLEEEAVVRLVRMKLQSGEFAESVRIYRDYEERLRKELGTRPSKFLRDLLNRKGQEN